MAYPPPQPTSYKTNVNRAKTKRWVEAKSYSYDGDDWGDADEYDEYGADEEPPPQQKPTGFRQPGQSANQPSPLSSSARSEDQQALETAQHEYRNIGGQSVTQLPPASTSTEPQPQVTPNIVRSNSFDRGDEKRTFSAASHQQNILAASPVIRQGQTLLPPFPQASNQAPQSLQGASPPPLIQKAPYRAPPAHRDPLQTSRVPSSITSDDHYQSPDPFSTEHRHNLPELGGPPLRIESQLSGDMERRNPDQRHSPSSNYRGVSYSDQPFQPRNSSLGSRTHSMTSNNSSLDFHNRRDFTPSAMPPPLQTRGSPSPREPFDPQAFAQHPPRKSSLSQGVLPNADGLDQLPQLYPPKGLGGDQIANEDQPGNIDTPQPLPFPRPADIYKRIAEEREKELRSPTSSRPSMELGGPTETESTTIRPHAGPHSIDDHQVTGSSRTEVLGSASDVEASHNLRTPLQTVAERKSEYGFDGLQVDEQNQEADRKETSLGQNTHRPFLPDVTRMSGFGDLLLSAGAITGEHSEPASQERTSHLTQDAPSHHRIGASLQHQPSLGLRSVVHQAFDQEPETPSSVAGSGIGRSTSGGTSVVSPILSRGVSLAKRSGPASGPASIPETRVVSPSANDDESDTRLISCGNMDTPKPIVRKPSPSRSSLQDSTESIPTTFKPGHRRNFSTPNSDGSPARTPILETNLQTMKPLQAEITMATPTDPTQRSPITLQPQIAPISDGKSEGSRSTPVQTAQQPPSQSATPLPPLATPSASRIGDSSQGSRQSGSADSPADTMTRSRAESPSKNRVRDLAGKFESGNNSRRGSDLSIGLSGGVTPKKDNISQARPPADRLESFRPHFPGGWESYASTIPAATPSAREPSAEGRSEGKIKIDDVPGASKNISSAQVTPNAESPTKGLDVSLPKTESAQASSDPFATAAAAGSALAQALVAAMGIKSEESPIDSDALQLRKEPVHEDSPKQSVITTRNLATSGNTVVHPEASRTLMSSTSDDEESDGQPSPPPKEPAKEVAQQPTDASSGSARGETAAVLQGSSVEETGSVENAAHPYPQPMLPPLSIDLTAHQYESDRLRREIVKNLSPRGTSEPTTATVESESPWQDESTMSADPSLGSYRHDSMALPSEYESYWNGSNAGSRTNSAHIKYESQHDPDQRFHDETIKPPQPLQLSAAQQNRNSDDVIPANKPSSPPNLSQERYSWDAASGESLTQKPTVDDAATSQSYVPSPDDHDSNKALNDAPIPFTESQDNCKFVAEPSGPSNQGRESLALASDRFLEDKERSLQSDISASSRAQDYSEKMPLDRDEKSDREKQARPVEIGSLPLYPGATIVSEPPPASRDDHSSLDPLPTDRDYGNQTAGVGSQNLPQSQAPIADDPERYVKVAPPHNSERITPSPPVASTPQAKVASFRDILALQTPAERIRAFNETREQLANLDQGLTHWLVVKTNEMPEHASSASVSDQASPVAAGQKPSAFKSKLPGIRSSGAQQAQQPYYQQYLNATPQASGSEANIGQPASASNSSQSLPPGGGTSGKLSSQQVQAKGKDFLHSAGVLGGKANVAAKGFFSKGRSKLRGSTGVDKVTNANHSPDPYSEGPQPHSQPLYQPLHQPLHQPHGEPTTSYASQPILQQASSVESNSSLPHATSIATALPPKEKTSDQRSQPWQTDEDSSKNEPTVSGPLRTSSLLLSNIVISQDTSTSAGANEPATKAVVGDTPIFLHATPEAESYISSPQAQRQLSNSSGNQTPTQADFTNSGPNVQTSNSTLTDDKAGSQEQQESDGSKKPEPTLSWGPQQGMENEKRGITVPHSRYSTHILPSTDKNQVEPEGFSEPEPSIASEPQILLQTSVQESLPTSSSASQIIPDALMNSTQVTPRQGTSNERPTRPFSFMEIPDNETNQRPIETAQREPSISSSDGRQFYDRPPSPVSPQRSITREVSDLHEQDQYYPHRSSSRPLQDPNIGNHPAYRRVSQPRQDLHPSFEHYPGRTTREDARLPRQHTIDYRPEGVGPIPVSQPEPTAFKSHRGSRSSTFFRNLAKSEEPPLPTNGSDQAQFTAKSPTQATAPNEGKRIKRNSVFRTLTGRSGGGDRDSNRGSISEKPPVIPQPKSPARQYTPTIPPPPPSNNTRVESNTPSKVKSKTLQRASTSVAPEKKDGGKKKRFSAIGSLFGRSSHEKSSSMQARPPQPPPQYHQQTPPLRQSQASQTYTPRQDPSSYNQYSEPAYRIGQAESMNSRYGSPPPPPQQQGYARSPPEGGYYAPDRTPSRVYAPDRISATRVASPPPSPATYPRRGPEAPAYMQDASLRQPGFQSPTSPSRFSSSAATQQRIASPPPQAIGETRFYDHTSANGPRRSAWARTPSQLQPTSSSVPRVTGMENPYPPRQDSLNSSAAAAAMTQQQPPNPRNTHMAAYQQYNNPPAPPTSQSPPQSRVPSSMYAAPPPTQEISGGPRRSSSPAPPAPPPKDDGYPLAHSLRSSRGLSTSLPPPSSAADPNSSYDSSSSTTTTTVTTTTPYSTTIPFFPLPINERSQSPPLPPHAQSTNENGTTSTSSSSAAAAARYHQLPPIQTSIPAQNAGESREQQQQQHDDGVGVFVAELGGGRVDDDEDEEIVMSSTSYPGQEWTPSRYERWDGD